MTISALGTSRAQHGVVEHLCLGALEAQTRLRAPQPQVYTVGRHHFATKPEKPSSTNMPTLRTSTIRNCWTWHGTTASLRDVEFDLTVQSPVKEHPYAIGGILQPAYGGFCSGYGHRRLILRVRLHKAAITSSLLEGKGVEFPGGELSRGGALMLRSATVVSSPEGNTPTGTRPEYSDLSPRGRT